MNVVQSVDSKQPNIEPEAVSQSKSLVVRVRPSPAVSTSVTSPAEYERPPEKVVVAIQRGFVPSEANTLPCVPDMASVFTCELLPPYKICPFGRDVFPVPPKKAVSELVRVKVPICDSVEVELVVVLFTIVRLVIVELALFT